MYSFEKRSPATWVWVSPAARRSERSRSPIREAGAAGVVAVGDFADGASTSFSTERVGGGVHLVFSQGDSRLRRCPHKG